VRVYNRSVLSIWKRFLVLDFLINFWTVETFKFRLFSCILLYSMRNFKGSTGVFLFVMTKISRINQIFPYKEVSKTIRFFHCSMEKFFLSLSASSKSSEDSGLVYRTLSSHKKSVIHLWTSQNLSQKKQFKNISVKI